MNPSTAQGRVVVDELIRCGVTDVVLAPGSRSAPLALAFAAADARGLVRLHVRLDERSAGFLAVGLAQVSGRAAVVVTTSGTAVANLTPAMVEASYAGVPVIAITADRPPELRDTGANQSIDQVKAFGTLARWSHDLAVAEPRPGQVGYWRSVIDRAVDASIESVDPGPVHVNVALRMPLTPEEDDPGWVEDLGLLPVDLDPDDLPDVLPRTVDGRLALSAAQPLDEVLAPFVTDDLAITELFRSWGADQALEDFTGQINDLLQRIGPDATAPSGDAANANINEDEDDDDDDDDDDDEGDYEDPGTIVPSRGVVVVGHGGDLEQGDAAVALAEACGWPLIGEPTGNARSGDTTLTHGPILLADKDFADKHQPDVAVVVGTVGLERSVLDLISRTPLVVTVDPRVAVRRADPTRSTTVHVAVVPEAPDDYEAYDDSWLDGWLAADAQARTAVQRTLDATETLTGPDVARTVWDVLGPEHLLVVASSWPVRHLGSFARVREGADAPLVVGNRGASGIDGVVSTAWGAALAHQDDQTAVVEDGEGDITVVTTRGATAYVLLGDLAFLHDHNGLVVGAQEPAPDLVYVVVDNDGGGIFSQLEPAGSEHFERVFGTPHGLDLVAVAAAAGIPARRVVDVGELVHALDETTAAGGVHVIVAKVGSRESEAALLRAVQAAVGVALHELADDDPAVQDSEA
ncbi:MAG TPA: thiamine pyrophosphate-binding protein [Candidatus Nanopelagicales bacterium]